MTILVTGGTGRVGSRLLRGAHRQSGSGPMTAEVFCCPEGALPRPSTAHMDGAPLQP